MRYYHFIIINLLITMGCMQEAPVQDGLCDEDPNYEPLPQPFEESSQFVKSISAQNVPDSYSLIWEDQFNDTNNDTDKWVVASLKDPTSGDLVPGAKGDHLLNFKYEGYITDEDTYQENGSLILRNQKRQYQGTSPAGNYDYTSGWVMSMHKGFFKYGYIEMKAKFPSGDKVWPAFWLIAEDLKWGPEWDIFEYFGYRSDQGYDVMGNHLLHGEWPNEKWSSHWIQNFDDVYDCEAWHTYGFEWTEDRATWMIDGKIVHRLNNNNSIEWPDEEMYIVLNNGQKTDSPDETTSWPNTLEVDYLEVFQKRPTDMYLDNIDFTLHQDQKNHFVTAYTTIKDETGELVPNANVSVSWTDVVICQRSGVTDNNGIVELVSPSTPIGGSFTLTVDNITKDCYKYNPLLNVETSDTIDNPE